MTKKNGKSLHLRSFNLQTIDNFALKKTNKIVQINCLLIDNTINLIIVVSFSLNGLQLLAFSGAPKNENSVNIHSPSTLMMDRVYKTFLGFPGKTELQFSPATLVDGDLFSNVKKNTHENDYSAC